MAKPNKLPRPKNAKLPYFAYDSFKPGEIAFPLIEYFVDDIEKTSVEYPVGTRNGVPALLDKKSQWDKTEGYLIKFNKNTVTKYYDKTNAYDFIRSTKNKNLYEWRTIELENGEKVNAIFGLDEKYFPKEDIGYTGKHDPSFNEFIEHINNNLNNSYMDDFIDNYLYLQMNYMLLWSCIDKYLALCYGGWYQNSNVKELSRWRSFKEALSHINRYDRIHSLKNNKKLHLNKKYSNSINYYYQLRCNIVHEGKILTKETYKVRNSLNELLLIFSYILNDTFYGEKRGCQDNHKYLEKLEDASYTNNSTYLERIINDCKCRLKILNKKNGYGGNKKIGELIINSGVNLP